MSTDRVRPKEDRESNIDSAIDEFVSLVESLEPLETMGHLELSLWQIAGPENTKVPLVSPAVLEYVAGLYSSIPERNHSHRRPTPDELTRIKEQFQKIIGLYVFEPARLARAALEPRREDVSVTALLYFLAGHDEGYAHRLWKLFEDRYSRHDSAIQRILGLTTAQIAGIFRFLHSQMSQSVHRYVTEYRRLFKEPMKIWQDWRSGRITTEQMIELTSALNKTSHLGKELDEFNRRARKVSVIDRRALDEKFGRETLDRFLQRFSASFGQVNRDFKKPTDFNALNKTPVLTLQTGQLFVPASQLMSEVPTRTLYYDLMGDLDYSHTFERENGRFQEQRAIQSFSRILGSGKIFGPLKYGPNKEFETDGLGIFDNQVIVIESKSKRLTAQAKLGNYDEIVNDFSLAIQGAYEQGLRAKRFILSNASAEFELADGAKIVIQRRDVADVYAVSVTSESYGPLMINIASLLVKDKNESFPWVVSLADQDLISDYFPNPYQFFHFLGRRLKCYGKVISADELDYVANYLVAGLYFEEELRSADIVMLFGFAQKFDIENLKARGLKIDDPISPPQSPAEYAELLKTVQFLDEPGHTSIMLTLLDLDQKTRQTLIDAMTKTTERTRADGQVHNFTLRFENDFGISFLSMVGRHDLRDAVVRHAYLKKYKQKKRKWLSLGRALEDPRYSVNEYCLLNFEWKQDNMMDPKARP